LALVGFEDDLRFAIAHEARAHFDRETFAERVPHPLAKELALKISEETLKHTTNFLDAHAKIDRDRQEKVFSAFTDSDPRRIFSDTILGFAAAELSDFSQKLGQADPFSRLARRLSLWFKPSLDHSRYGIPLPEDGRAVRQTVVRLGDLLTSQDSKLKQLVRIWAGVIPVEASEDGLLHIKSLLTVFDARLSLDGVLGLEILGSLTGDLDSLDVDALNMFSGFRWSAER
jgi:hypothetical protein